MATVNFRIGDTFSAECQYSDTNGNGVSLTQNSITVTSQIRNLQGGLISNLVVTPNPDQVNFPGRYTLSAASTNSWPAGLANWNIKYTSPGGSTSSDPIALNILNEITV